MNKEIFVIKRSGEKEKFNPSKIKKVLKWACVGLDVDADKVLEHFEFNYTSDGISTINIHKSLIEACLDLISIESPDYQYVAGRLLNYSLRKSVWGGNNPPRLIDIIKTNVKLGNYDKSLLENYTAKEINKINEFIDHNRDFDFTHGGIKQMMDKYLVQNRKTGEIFETPQFAYVLVAMTLFAKEEKDRLDWIKKAYDSYSTWKINLATPVIAGARTPLRSFASCALFAVDDSLDSIGATDYLLKKASASRYGLGLDISRIRPVGAAIRHGDVLHTGLVPYLKNFESGIKSCHQNGIRGSSATVFINWWHAQVEDVIVLKNNALPDERAVRFLDYCLVFSDLLINRVKNKQNITLFNPHETPELQENFGLPCWDEMYLKREQDPTVYKKVIPAISLMTLYAKERLGTGRIYSMHIENSNKYSPFLEKIGQSNLCVSGDQRVVTSHGLLTAKDLYENYGDLTVFNNNKSVKSSKMHLIANNSDVYTIRLENGLSHTITDYHKVLIRTSKSGDPIVTEDREMKDLTIGDYVAIQTKKGIFGTLSLNDLENLPKSPSCIDTDKTKIPDYYWKANEATQKMYILSLRHVDENTPPSSFYITSTSKSFLEELQILSLNLGFSTTIDNSNFTIANGQDCYRLSFSFSEERDGFSKIVSIEYKGKEDVYCISVDHEDKHFVCNGIITHNCMEILHPTIPSQKWNDEDAYIGVCILAGINALYVKKDEFESICEIAVRQLDNLISYQTYFDKAAENFAKKYRSLAIGTLNFAGLLAEKGIRYDTPEAAKAAAELAEKISYYSIKASIKLAKERGAFEFFNKTKWSNCELPIDRYCENIDQYIDPPKLDWESLRDDLKKYGIRNSTLTGYMPVESSSVISGSTSGIEPIRDYIVSKTSKAGKVVVVAPNLKRDFVNYSLAFDLPIEAMQLVYAAFSKYTCMAISANNYVNVSHYENKQVPLSVVVKDTLAYFNLGGKTQYYFNTEDDSGEDSGSGCSSGACSI
jgi:ribonucleotide reductase alpha subunit